MSSLQNLWARASMPRRAVIRGLILFLVFLTFEALYENRELIDNEGSSCETLHADTIPPFYESIYPRLLKRRSPTPSGHVAIIFVPSDLGEVQENLCVGRSYLAALINTLNGMGSGPSAIVIDKYFSDTACEEIDPTTRKLRYPGTRELLEAVQAAKVPVIVGESTGAAPEKKEGSCLEKNPHQLDFKAQNVTHGLTKLNANREQIPLHWRVLRLAPATGSVSTESLALAAATAVPLQIARKDRLHAVLEASRHPYARLGLGLPVESSQALLCSAASAALKRKWGCFSAKPIYDIERDHVSFDPSGMVIVLGSQNEIDHWPVFGKRRWGYELQAEYLDALLSGNYYRAAGGKWIFILSLLFVFFLEAVPAIAEYCYCEKNQKVPKLLRDPELWLWIYPLLFIVFTIGLFLRLDYLPPMSLLGFVAVTMVGRLLFSKMDHYKDRMTPHKKELERDAS